MFRSTRKLVAVLMLLWLPLFSGSALAATVRMQMLHGNCHETVAAQTMAHCHMAGHHQHHGKMPAADEHKSSCDTCEVCHLVGTGYLDVPGLQVNAGQTGASEPTPYLVAFHSFTSAPLVPPPLVRA